ncbi:unnamed protein product [Cyclocybe aegerita]|uniref:Zn(2)-C6 fungal-type domain-containing protein n=1 Tax=Cyclocybe aegerita TaxID=1973307 RepID=A0A8S0W4C4_CYCAE|nr:unnamed protein product [Cyclocybe aegerita]
MSSSEEEDGIHSSTPRKRSRACDVCRKKKIRCNALLTPGARCSSCVACGIECTYLETPKRRTPSTGYVAGLEHRVQGLENIIRLLCPDDQTYEHWLGSLEEGSEEHAFSPRHQMRSSMQVRPGALVDRISRAIRLVGTDYQPTLDDHTDGPVAAEAMNPTTDRFFGKSSGESLANIAQWERKPEVSQSARYIFPEPDLSTALLDLFFEHINLYLPLLHRPSFCKSVQDGLHHCNDDFAVVYLTVESTTTGFLASPTLYNLQFYCLSVVFLQFSSSVSSVWTMIGVAVRSAQSVGVHRRKTTFTNSLENELWKRAFWVLLYLDRTISVSVGQSCAIQEEDYDVDMPIDCDDEYLDHPDTEQESKQPSGQPSLISAFILQIKLMQILIYCIRGIYSLCSTNWRFGLVGQKWKFHIVTELDSSLNKWLDSVPDHLRWDPDRRRGNFFNQSAMLYAMYYHIRILVHRPFIALPGRPSPLSIPSLTICTNAARACCHVVYTLLQRDTLASLPAVQVATLSSAVIMMFNIWQEKPPGPGVSLKGDPDMESVHKCMQVLKVAEERWHMAGRFWDLLHELTSLRDPLSPMQTGRTAKSLVSNEQEDPYVHSVSLEVDFVSPEILNHESSCHHRSSTGDTCSEMGDSLTTSRIQRPSSEPLRHGILNDDNPGSLKQQIEQTHIGSSSETSAAAPLLQNTIDATTQYNLVKAWDPDSAPQPTSERTVTSGIATPALAGAGALTTICHNSGQFQQVPIRRHISSNGPYALESQQWLGDGVFNDEMMNMWSNAPTGFGLDDWDVYLSGFPDFN